VLIGQGPFTIKSPTPIRFGVGASQNITSILPGDPRRIAFVHGASGIASDPVAKQIAAGRYTITGIPVAGEPSVQDVHAAYVACMDRRVDAIIDCGGGSVIDLGKALRFCLEMQKQLPDDIGALHLEDCPTDTAISFIAIPTTAGTGSEVTNNAVLSTAKAKLSLRNDRLFPTLAIVDPSLSMTASHIVTIGTGLDAIVQTIESFTSKRATPFTDSLTRPNISSGLEALRTLSESENQNARTHLSWLSLSSGLALSNGGLGAAHGLASVLGAHLEAPHGLLCGRLIGPVLLQNHKHAVARPEIWRKLDHSIKSIELVSM
jgi:alcohol dehydrogenase class IV